jgi:geranylgeranyl diphosphate synthase type I
MIEEVVAGQMLDVSLMLAYEVQTDIITRKNELKTALYSFVNPMLIGSRLAKSFVRDDFYRQFGLLVGQAFQIQDDLLDIVGSSKHTGKKTFIDIQDGQHTVLSQYIFKHAGVKDVEILMSLFGKPVDNHGRKVLTRLFETTGAVQYAEKEVARLIKDAFSLIDAVDMELEDKEQWKAFLSLLSKRTT